MIDKNINAELHKPVMMKWEVCEWLSPYDSLKNLNLTLQLYTSLKFVPRITSSSLFGLFA